MESDGDKAARSTHVRCIAFDAATNLSRPKTLNTWIISLFGIVGIARNAVLVSNPSLDFRLPPRV